MRLIMTIILAIMFLLIPVSINAEDSSVFDSIARLALTSGQDTGGDFVKVYGFTNYIYILFLFPDRDMIGIWEVERLGNEYYITSVTESTTGHTLSYKEGYIAPPEIRKISKKEAELSARILFKNLMNKMPKMGVKNEETFIVVNYIGVYVYL